MPRRRELSSNRARRRRTVQPLGPLLWAVALFLWSGRAEAVAVALLRPAPDVPSLDETLFRLQGELLALGVSVTILEGPAAPEGDSSALRTWLERTSRERGIDAFIVIVGQDAPVAADVWLCERSPPRLRLSRVGVEPTAENRSAALAIHAIEVLRSSFLALDLTGHDRTDVKATTPAPAPNEAAPREPIARFGLEAGATALLSTSDVGPAVVPLVRVDWTLTSWLSLQATAAGLGTRPRIETPAGDVRVAREFALIGLCLCAPVRRSIEPFFELSVGALHTGLDARADAPNVAHRVERWSTLADAGAGARVGLPGGAYVTMAAQVELAEPYSAIHVLDSVVATTGRPNLLLTLTAGVRP